MRELFFSRARQGHFQLESGHHSDLWLDLEALCLHPRAVEPLTADLAARLRRYPFDVVCGPLNEGAFVSLMVARELDCEFTYAERVDTRSERTLFPVEYRVPPTLHSSIRRRRVAIVNDVTSAGSAVRGTFAHVEALGGNVVVLASLLVLGGAIRRFGEQHHVPVEALEEMQHNLWVPAECPLCARGDPLEPHSR